MMTVRSIDVNSELVANKIGGYIGQFYKILPIKESGENTLVSYMSSLQREMLGCKELICALKNDQQYLTLLSILQYLIDNECDVGTVKTEVFKSISILKKLQNKINTIEE